MADDPCRLRESVGADGARLTGYFHGAHLTGWWPAGHDASALWMSPSTRCAPGIAIRGGVPVIFPQFGTLGPLRKHGFVRDVPWNSPSTGGARLAATSEAGARRASMVAETAVGPAEGWPHQARLTLTATAMGATLAVRLDVRNAGPSALTFTAALHTYLAVQEPGSVIVGLGGASATNAMAGGAASTLPGEIPTSAAMDLMVRDVAERPITIAGPSGPVVTMTARGFADRVVWNPGTGQTLPDVPPGEEARFVCVEPAVLEPVLLTPGGRWSGVMELQSVVRADA